MNKLIISLSLLLAGFNSLAHTAAPTANSLSRAITDECNLTFGKDNLLLQRINKEESDKWFDMIDDIRTFVENSVPSSYLNKKVEDLWQASADLLNTLKELYGTTFSKGPLQLTKDIKDAVERKLAVLRETQKNIKEIVTDSKKVPSSEKPDHKMAREVVNKLALFLDSIYGKVFIDWVKINKKQ